MMIFLILGTIQIAMLQHARLMTEYAAYNAVRSGIVWNGNQCMMRRAAVVSLLPTLGATDTILGTSEPFGYARPGLLETWVRNEVLVSGIAGAGSVLDALGIGDPGFRLIDVHILNPTPDDIGMFADGQELDFDAVRGFPNGDFFSNPNMRDATVLTGRVTFFYPMRIPFANWTIFYSYLASRAGQQVSGGFFRHGVDGSNIVQEPAVGTHASGLALAAAGGSVVGLDGEEIASATIMALVWDIGNRTGVYLFPLEATQSMRMQSNFYVSSFDQAGACID
jgi:hypothetical protein